MFSLPTEDRSRLEEQGAEKFAAVLRRRVAELEAFLAVDPNRWLELVDEIPSRARPRSGDGALAHMWFNLASSPATSADLRQMAVQNRDQYQL